MKGRKKRATGGSDLAADDIKMKPEARNNAKKIEGEADERKAGGRAKKHVDMHGTKADCRADRKPRKNGGRTGADKNPFSSARHGSPGPGRKMDAVTD